jgi:uncharacterized protein (TIGR02145 family)/uncharacterized repeat protein (TIGR02543 family)
VPSGLVQNGIIRGTPVLYEGETYETVVIGIQTWMARNLNYAAEGSVCYGNQDNNCVKYGRLYNWATAMGIASTYNSNYYNTSESIMYRGICPEGWHIPSNADWKVLHTIASDKALRAVSGWNSSSDVGTDEFGFSALPGGEGSSNGFFNDVGNRGRWWSASESNSGYAYGRYIYYDSEDAYYSNYSKNYLYSVRCLQDYTDSSVVPSFTINNITYYTITYNANNGTGAPGIQIRRNGFAPALSTTVPTRTGYTFASWNTSADGSGRTYEPGAPYSANAAVTLYAQWNQTSIIHGTPVLYEGETYETVVIGNQTWLARNLNVAVEGSRCYGDSQGNCAIYGRLYDWATAMALPGCGYGNSCASQIGAKHKGICPTGWHIPTQAEWNALITTVGGLSTAGKILKATSGWILNGNGTDEFGFSALPGGYGGYFQNIGINGYWWSASEYDACGAYRLSMTEAIDKAYWGSDDKDALLSVRCLQD